MSKIHYVNIMAIMRSEEKWTMSKDLKTKVKRPRVDWFQKIILIVDKERRNQVWHDYYRLMAKHPKMSQNRLAYNALRNHYSHRSLDTARWLGCGVD